MTIQIPPSEWEALSAFLDNQLSERDRSRLEARLKNEPELRQALDDLRRTRLILRSQPRLRAPRNFTLTAAAAGVRTRRFGGFASPFNTLRLASALATIFLILITVGDLGVRRFAPAPSSVAMSEPADGPIWGMGGGGGGGGGGVAPEVAPMAAPTEAPAAMEAMPAEPAAASEMPEIKSLMVTPVGTTNADEALRQGKEPPTAMDGPPVDVANSRPIDGRPADARQAVTAPASTLIRTLQALLILMAVGAGIAALILRRSAG